MKGHKLALQACKGKCQAGTCLKSPGLDEPMPQRRNPNEKSLFPMNPAGAYGSCLMVSEKRSSSSPTFPSSLLSFSFLPSPFPINIKETPALG